MVKENFEILDEELRIEKQKDSVVFYNKATVKYPLNTYVFIVDTNKQTNYNNLSQQCELLKRIKESLIQVKQAELDFERKIDEIKRIDVEYNNVIKSLPKQFEFAGTMKKKSDYIKECNKREVEIKVLESRKKDLEMEVKKLFELRYGDKK